MVNYPGILYRVALALCWFTIGAFAQVPAELIQYPELILHNATVLTVDDQDTVAQAVAVRDGTFLAVGSNAEVLRLAGPETRKIDLEGQTVIPGIINTHIHPNKDSVPAYFKEVPPDVQQMLRASGRIQDPRDKADVLAQIQEIARRETGPWVKITAERVDYGNHELRIHELDEVVPDRPLFIILSGWWGIINSRALEELQKAYPEPAGLIEENGKITGHVMSVAFWMMREEILPKPAPAAIAPAFGKYLLEYLAPEGITTFSTRLAAHEIQAYRLLDAQGTMPLRLAFGHEVGRWNPRFERDMRRIMTDVIGYGTDKIWLNSISVALPDSNPDGGAGSVCSTFPKLKMLPSDHFPEGLCLWEIPGDPTRDTILQLNRLGYRVGNIHTYGDLGLQMLIETLEKANQEQPIYRYTAADHSQLFNPTVIEKSGQLGMIWSMSASQYAGDRGAAVEFTYGKEVADRMLAPARSLLEAGAMVSSETNKPFEGMARFVTRKTARGTILGAGEAVDRKTALQMITRNGAKYVLKEDVLGSIEVGKWGDLVVLDKNPLDEAMPDEELANIQVLMSILAGDVIYDHANADAPAQWDRDRGGQIFAVEQP